MKIYTLCVGHGADAGDWPELGAWHHFTSLGRLLEFAKMDLGLGGRWCDLDGMPANDGKSGGPGTDWPCLAYQNDIDNEGDGYADAVARVHVEEVKE